jgi:hypothetical protein
MRGLSRACPRRNRLAALLVLFLLSTTFSSFFYAQFPASASDDKPSPSSWSVTVVDPKGFWTPSIAIDKAGRPHIVYLAEPNELRYASWIGSSWQFEKVDTWSIMGNKASLALDSNDTPHIAYYDWDERDLKYAYKNGTIWTIEVVDEYGDVGRMPSLAIDSHNIPHISYYNMTNLPINDDCSLKYAVRDGNPWRAETVVDSDFYDYDESDTSLKLNATDEPRIAYAAYQILYYASWTGSIWRIESAPKDPGDTGNFPSLALDSRGDPHIAYLREWDVDRLDYATKGLLGWVTQTIDAGRGYSHAIALDSRDRPHIAYTTGTVGPVPPYYLYYAEMNGPWVLTTVDASDGVAGPLSIAIDGCDGVHIAYTRNYSGGNELKYAYLPGQDLTPPKSTASSPGPYWHNGPASVSAIANDSCSGVSNVTLWYRQSGDNSTWGQWTQYSTLSSQHWTWSFTFPAGDGHYQFHTTSSDNAGNEEPPPLSADAIAGYDSTPPVSSATPMRPYWQATPSAVVDATATDSLSGVAEVTLLYSHAPLDNSTWSPWISLGMKTSQPWSWPFPFPDGEGNYKFHTIARDVAGNVEGAKTTAEAIAGYRSPPDYVPDSPLPSSQAVVGLTLSLNLSLSVRNLGGETNETATLAFYNDSTPSSPFLTIQVPPVPPGTASGPFSAAWTSPATPCSCRVVADVDYGNDVDESNETNNVCAWTIDVVSGPVTSIVVGDPRHTSPASVTYVKSSTPIDFSYTDQSGFGIRNTTYTVDGGTPVNYTAIGTLFLAGEGMHTIEWRSLDWAGNLEEVSSKMLTVDNTPPATTITQSEVQATIETFFTLTAADSGCGVNVTMYRIDGGSWMVYTGGFTLAEGEHTIYYYSIDNLGNVEQERSLVVKPPVEIAVNYKPVVALVFAIILLVAGVWSSKRGPWKGGKDRMAVVKALAITSLPFVLLEAATGVASQVTGYLSVPPVVGIGSGADLVILMAGLAAIVLRAHKKIPMPE